MFTEKYSFKIPFQSCDSGIFLDELKTVIRVLIIGVEKLLSIYHAQVIKKKVSNQGRQKTQVSADTSKVIKLISSKHRGRKICFA